MKRLFFWLNLFWILSVSASPHPVDICFLIADLKYSAERGVKICEIQNGNVSSFKGDRFSHDGKGVIVRNFIQALSNYQTSCWTAHGKVADHELQELLADAPGWNLKGTIDQIQRDADFLKLARQSPADPF